MSDLFMDLVFIAAIIVFFAIAATYIAVCDRLRKGGENK
jgi:hypothetical protein